MPNEEHDLHPAIFPHSTCPYTVSNPTGGWRVLRVCQQITFVTLNRFCLLSKPDSLPTPLFLTDNIKKDGMPTKTYVPTNLFWTGDSRFERLSPVLPFYLDISLFWGKRANFQFFVKTQISILSCFVFWCFNCVTAVGNAKNRQ